MIEYDIAFMGGGVRGIAHAGVIVALEDAGYMPRRVCGTSAGAIVAALVAAGYSGKELRQILLELNYTQFKSRSYATSGLFGEFLHLRKDYGIYSADFFEDWLAGLLKAKGKSVFGDLGSAVGIQDAPLLVTAADLTTRQLFVFPQDATLFGWNPKHFSIAKAVRMSMSIPLFYEPYRMTDTNGKECLIVDGGIFCNYPIGLLDDTCSTPTLPIFGARFVECSKSNATKTKFFKLTEYIEMVIGAVLDAQNHTGVQSTQGDAMRTISISGCVEGENVKTTDFNISKKTAAALFDNGYNATKALLENWNFEQWVAYRKSRTKVLDNG